MSVLQWCAGGEGGDDLKDAELGASIGAVLTLLTDRRIEILEELPASMEGEPEHVTFISYTSVFDRRLVAPVEVVDFDATLRKFLGKLISIPEERRTAVAAALDLHYGSALLFEKDLSAAYTLAIAGIEALSRAFGAPPSDWSDWDQSATWDKFSRRHKLPPELYDALKAKLMKNQHLRLKETFAQYGSYRLPDDFWDDEWNEWIYNVRMPDGVYDGGDWSSRKRVRDYLTADREVLRAALRRSYDARSGFVHTGNRTVNTSSELYSKIHASTDDRPLSYACIRSILSKILREEIDKHADTADLPDVTLTHGSPEET
ncbi:hypothetical protein [Amycolatopsis thermoflava]|uniref:hypothetical protein n=1 Tax=Amycolatopsis thermoflava TaxID=84480 RepID=UPI0012F71493|nr:hypothetical protein [Amycolatopsis thermoflava]